MTIPKKTENEVPISLVKIPPTVKQKKTSLSKLHIIKQKFSVMKQLLRSQLRLIDQINGILGLLKSLHS